MWFQPTCQVLKRVIIEKRTVQWVTTVFYCCHLWPAFSLDTLEVYQDYGWSDWQTVSAVKGSSGRNQPRVYLLINWFYFPASCGNRGECGAHRQDWELINHCTFVKEWVKCLQHSNKWDCRLLFPSQAHYLNCFFHWVKHASSKHRQYLRTLNTRAGQKWDIASQSLSSGWLQ